MSDTVELWGTFAVADHLRPKPFVTDVLLYDRLVVPVPKEGHRDADWRNRWDADKLRGLLDVLGDLAVPMPWGEAELDEGLMRYGQASPSAAVAKAVTDDMRDIRAVDPDAPAYQVTRRTLADYANQKADNELFVRLKALAQRPGTKIEAVTAYGSPEDLRRGLGIRESKQADGQQASIDPAAVFDWTLHVPEGDDELKLLKQATSLAGRSDFREHRSYFYNRLRDLSGLSNEEVRGDLYRRLADYERIMRRQGWHTTARRATQVLLIGPGLLALIEPITATLAGAAIGAAAYYVSEHLDRPEADEMTRVAAMAYDIKRQFGDKLRFGSVGP